jgi:hypothetical protein
LCRIQRLGDSACNLLLKRGNRALGNTDGNLKIAAKWVVGSSGELEPENAFNAEVEVRVTLITSTFLFINSVI